MRLKENLSIIESIYNKYISPQKYNNVIKKIILFFIIIFGIHCNRELSRNTITSKQYLPNHIKVLRYINVRKRPGLNSKISDTVIKGESFPVEDIYPRALFIKHDIKKGWIFPSSTNAFKIINSKIRIKKRLYLYTDFYKTNICGYARKNAIYTLKKVIPRYYKIKLDNNKEGWIYAGTISNNWVSNYSNLKENNKKQVNYILLSNKATVRTDGLVLWNKLEPGLKSVVGPNGEKSGDISFLEGGVLIDDDEEYIDFDDRDGKLLGHSGAIEFIISPRGWSAEDGKTSDGDWKWLWQSVNYYVPNNRRIASFFDLGFMPHRTGFGWRITKEYTKFYGFGENGFIVPGLNLEDGKKYHLAVVWNEQGIHGSKDTCRLYFNGKLLITTQNELKIPTIKNRFRLGNSGVDYFRSTDPFCGIIYDIKVYNIDKTNFSPINLNI